MLAKMISLRLLSQKLETKTLIPIEITPRGGLNRCKVNQMQILGNLKCMMQTDHSKQELKSDFP